MLRDGLVASLSLLLESMVGFVSTQAVKRDKESMRHQLGSFSASTRVAFENRSALCRFYRVVEIDLIEMSYDPRADPRPLDARTQDVSKEFYGFRGPQLDRSHRFFPSSRGDRGVAGSTHIAHPVDVAEGAISHRLPENSTSVKGVVRGSPLFRPRMVMRTLGPSGTLAAKRVWAMGLK
jgi:hypothetical protein